MNPACKLAVLLLLTAYPAFAQSSAAKAGETQRQEAMAFEQQGKTTDAETAWRAYLKTHPADPEPYAHLGLLAARQEDYKAAVPLYRKALALNPKIPGLRLNLGLALFKSGDLKAAAPEFVRALKSVPANSPDAQRLAILAGMAHYGSGQFKEAIPYLKQAAASDTQNLTLRLTLAHSCLWAKQYQCVLDVYHEILMLNAESAEADMLAGEASDELKDRVGAIAQFRAAVKANPKEPNVHFGLGYLLWTERQYPEAITELKTELDSDPTHLQAMLYLGDAYLQSEQPQNALPLLEKALQIDPSLWLAHLDLGIIYSDSGRQEDALLEMQAAARIKPDEVNIHWRLGRLYRTMGKRTEAQAEFDKARSITQSTAEGLVQKISGGQARTQGAEPAPPTKP